jgi:hypothetical protein
VKCPSASPVRIGRARNRSVHMVHVVMVMGWGVTCALTYEVRIETRTYQSDNSCPPRLFGCKPKTQVSHLRFSAIFLIQRLQKHQNPVGRGLGGSRFFSFRIVSLPRDVGTSRITPYVGGNARGGGPRT